MITIMMSGDNDDYDSFRAKQENEGGGVGPSQGKAINRLSLVFTIMICSYISF